MIKQLQWGHMVLNDFLVTLDSVQLCSGFSTPLLTSTSTQVDYFEPNYIIDVQCCLAELGASLWSECAWTPHLQQEGDSPHGDILQHSHDYLGKTLQMQSD